MPSEPTLLHSSDTIVACATARAASAVAVVRLSGPQSHTIAYTVAGKRTALRYASLVWLRDAKGQPIDQALQILFQGPSSFSGEDMVEWHCHGGTKVVDLVLERALELGARAAEAGEFTKRAFLNGKLDLSQAEAIGALIETGSRRVARLAASALGGSLAEPLAQASDQIDQCRVQVEAHLDFSDEPIDPESMHQVSQRVHRLQPQLQRLIGKARHNLDYAHIPQVVLAGAPNSGKSSLFNCLLDQDRALVSPEAGTTRDFLRESLACGDTQIQLADTAGLRQGAGSIEQQGIERTWKTVGGADVILLVFDATAAVPQALCEQIIHHAPRAQLCLVANKIDLTGQQPHTSTWLVAEQSVVCHWLSAQTQMGVDGLRQWLVAQMQQEQPEGTDAFLVRARHLEALSLAAAELDQVAALLAEHAEAHLELIAEGLRVARQALGELSGHGASDALLSKIFSQFCIGK